jgi:NAD(P)-dependent dehydrogenase (short-subunit alcohol dehydrogenase family)
MATVTIDHPRVTVVTGGSGGIGGETAQRLARDGMAIVRHVVSNDLQGAEP